MESGGLLSMLGGPGSCRPASPLVSVCWEPVAPPSLFFFFFNFLIVFIYFWLCWVFIAACPFLWLQHRGSSLWGVSCQGAQVLRQAGSAVAAHMTSCSAASGIFWMDQGSNLCPLHWQAGS